MGNPEVSRAVFLKRRTAQSGPELDDFEIRELALAPLEAGQLLVRNIVMSVDPSMRGRLDVGEKHYTTNFEIGQPLDGSAIGVVIGVPNRRSSNREPSCGTGWAGEITP